MKRSSKIATIFAAIFKTFLIRDKVITFYKNKLHLYLRKYKRFRLLIKLKTNIIVPKFYL